MAGLPTQELSGDNITNAIRRAQGPMPHPPPGVPPRPPRDPDRPAPVEEPPNPVPIPRPEPPPHPVGDPPGRAAFKIPPVTNGITGDPLIASPHANLSVVQPIKRRWRADVSSEDLWRRATRCPRVCY